MKLNRELCASSLRSGAGGTRREFLDALAPRRDCSRGRSQQSWQDYSYGWCLPICFFVLIKFELFISLLLFPLVSMAQGTVVQNGKPFQTERWITTQFGKGKTPPFSFEYGGVPSAVILRRCQHSLTRLPSKEENQLRYIASYTDRQTGLKVECEVTGWTDFGAVEWVLRFANTGNNTTPAISNVQTADITISTSHHFNFSPSLYYAEGSDANLADFAPRERTLQVGDTLRMVVRSVLYGDEWISTVPRVLHNLTPDAFKTFSDNPAPVPFKLTEIYFAISFIIWIHSLYIFCGTLMRKYSFVVATLALILSFAFTLWLGYDKLHLNMFYGTTNGDGVLVYEVGTLGYLLCVILPLLSAFNYWASFYIFKGFQLITNKWFNYDILKR